jgi:hypothetical protein
VAGQGRDLAKNGLGSHRAGVTPWQQAGYGGGAGGHEEEPSALCSPTALHQLQHRMEEREGRTPVVLCRRRKGHTVVSPATGCRLIQSTATMPPGQVDMHRSSMPPNPTASMFQMMEVRHRMGVALRALKGRPPARKRRKGARPGVRAVARCWRRRPPLLVWPTARAKLPTTSVQEKKVETWREEWEGWRETGRGV